MDFFATSLIAALVFAATNIDDIVLLSVFFAAAMAIPAIDRPSSSVATITAGQFLGIGFLVGASLIASSISLVIPAFYIRFLGLLPLGLGIYQLLPGNNDGATPPLSKVITVTGVTTITIANGGDNFAVYVPLFATQTLKEITITVVIFGIMTATWLFIAYGLVRHPYPGNYIQRFAPRLFPFILIGLGIFILLAM